MALVHSEKAGGLRSAWSIAWQALAWLIDWTQAWHRAAAEQRYLGGLNDYYLRDLGLSRSDIERDPMPFDRFQ